MVLRITHYLVFKHITIDIVLHLVFKHIVIGIIIHLVNFNILVDILVYHIADCNCHKTHLIHHHILLQLIEFFSVFFKESMRLIKATCYRDTPFILNPIFI